MRHEPHTAGVHWAADCVMQWLIFWGSIHYNYSFYLLECIATPKG